MTIRIGLIGAGANTASQHIPGFRKAGDVELTGVVNRSPESSQRIASQFDIPRIFDSPEAMCASADIDAVCIGTWPYKHREYAILALESGKHVLCEARMAMDLAEAQAMVAAAERHPDQVAQLVPAPFDFRLGPTITRMINDGELGQIHQVDVRVLNPSSLDRAAPLHWRMRREYSGKNVMMFGIFVEVVHRWLGDHDYVQADGDIVVTERTNPETGQLAPVTVPDTYVVTGRLVNGARITYNFSSVAGGGDPNGITVFGSKATIRWRVGDRAELLVHGQTPEEIAPDPGTDRGWRVEEDFVASVTKGAPVALTSFADGLRYMRVIDAAYESWQTGQRRSV